MGKYNDFTSAVELHGGRTGDITSSVSSKTINFRGVELLSIDDFFIIVFFISKLN